MSTVEWVALGGVILQALIVFSGFRYFEGRTGARLDNLEKKMDKHNNMMERIARLEQCNGEQDRRIDRIEERTI
jgi:uncharacterized membrane protein YGL010W